MRHELSAFALSAGIVLAPALHAADPPPARGPISVFVQARPDEPEPSAEQKAARKAASQAADKESDQLIASLKKQYGKDKAKWPEDKRNEFYDAVDKWGVAWSENYYYARPAKEKADSVDDTQKHLAKSRKDPWVVLADRKEDADLIVEILGRKGYAKFMTGPKWMGFDVMPGKVGADKLVKMPRQSFKPWFDERVWVMHWAKPKEPFLRMEVMDDQRWQDVAKYIVASLEELAKTYYAELKP